MEQSRQQKLRVGRNPEVRLLIVAGIAVFWMVAVFGRLTYLQLFRHADYLARAHRQQRRIIEITPRRGIIYDRSGRPLAMSVGVQSAFAVPAEIPKDSMAARLIAGVLDIPEEVIDEKLASNQGFVWLQRKLPPEKVEALQALNLKGVYFQEENQRFYPNGPMAAHVLGFVDVDEKGLGGIEHELDSQIRGKSEKIIVMADARQRWFDGEEARRNKGADVVLTIDQKIQYIAERELAAAIEKTHAPAGTVIVQNPNTGEILALANWPRFNPNAATNVPADARMDRAVSAVYEPGSTFKIITLASAFDQNLTRPDEVFDCENGRIYVAGHRVRDHKPFGLLTVAQILAKSSDVGAIKIAERVGPPKFYEYIRAFGFGQLTGIELPGESRGILRPLENWTPVSIGAVPMGQEVAVTPVQLVTAVSAIANGGMLYRPRVVAEVKRDSKELPMEGALAPTDPRRVIRPETAATLRTLMEGVVLQGGTGTLAHLDGWTAAGKTGSAQKIDPGTGRYSPTNFIASFTGFAPINNPAVTILVALDSPVGPHEGGMVAAPVFKRIAEQVLPYLDVPQDVPVNPKLMQTAFNKNQRAPDDSLEDFTPTDFSSQVEELPKQEPMPTAKTRLAASKDTMTVSVDQGGDVVVPDVGGKTMRDAIEKCLQLGLDPVPIGSGLALDQQPAAGAKVRRGAKITVRFGVPVNAKAAKGHAGRGE